MNENNQFTTAVTEVRHALQKMNTPELNGLAQKLYDAVSAYIHYDSHEDTLRGLFNWRHASLKEIEAAGWGIETNQGGHYWFRHRASRRIQSLPYWMIELLYQFRADGPAEREQVANAALKSFRAAVVEVFGYEPPQVIEPVKRARKKLPKPEMPVATVDGCVNEELARENEELRSELSRLKAAS